MCLGIPARVLELRNDRTALVELGELSTAVRTDLVPELAAGQYVVVHAGYAINVLDEKEAEETLEMLERLDALGGLP